MQFEQRFELVYAVVAFIFYYIGICVFWFLCQEHRSKSDIQNIKIIYNKIEYLNAKQNIDKLKK